VDVDRGACEESGAEGQFSEHTQGETHVPTVAEEPNLEVLDSTAAALGTESNALSLPYAMSKSPQSSRQMTIVCPLQQWTPWFLRQ
jgi:hypothetical protein